MRGRLDGEVLAMGIDPEECRGWAERVKAAWEITPLVEQQRHERIQVGFELELYARVPTEVPPGEERRARVLALWDRLREVAESLLPFTGENGRLEVEPFDAAVRLRPETQFAPEVLLQARLFHGPDLLKPVGEGERESLRPLEERLGQLGLRARSW